MKHEIGAAGGTKDRALDEGREIVRRSVDVTLAVADTGLRGIGSLASSLLPVVNPLFDAVQGRMFHTGRQFERDVREGSAALAIAREDGDMKITQPVTDAYDKLMSARDLLVKEHGLQSFADRIDACVDRYCKNLFPIAKGDGKSKGPQPADCLEFAAGKVSLAWVPHVLYGENGIHTASQRETYSMHYALQCEAKHILCGVLNSFRNPGSYSIGEEARATPEGKTLQKALDSVGPSLIAVFELAVEATTMKRIRELYAKANPDGAIRAA